MRILEACKLIDALAEWGSHNTEWRLGRKVREGLEAVEVALTYYSPLVSRILAGGPVACLRAEFVRDDLPLVNIADGRRMTDWATAVEQDGTHSGEYVRGMAAAGTAIKGPLICACVGDVVDGELKRLHAPFVVFDGWHRGAAWVLQCRTGQAYPIAARLIVTQQPAPLLGPAQPVRVEFRKARLPRDLRKLLAFDRSIFPKADLFDIEDWRRDESWWMLVDGIRAGCCAFEPHVDFQQDVREDETNPPMNGSLYISTTGILPRFQGGGLGRLFKSWQIAYARFHGFRRIVTNCRKRNTAIVELNASFGFRIIRTTPKYYSGPTDATVVMELRIHATRT